MGSGNGGSAATRAPLPEWSVRGPRIPGVEPARMAVRSPMRGEAEVSTVVIVLVMLVAVPAAVYLVTSLVQAVRDLRRTEREIQMEIAWRRESGRGER